MDNKVRNSNKFFWAVFNADSVGLTPLVSGSWFQREQYLLRKKLLRTLQCGLAWRTLYLYVRIGYLVWLWNRISEVSWRLHLVSILKKRHRLRRIRLNQIGSKRSVAQRSRYVSEVEQPKILLVNERCNFSMRTPSAPFMLENTQLPYSCNGQTFIL